MCVFVYVRLCLCVCECECECVWVFERACVRVWCTYGGPRVKYILFATCFAIESLFILNVSMSILYSFVFFCWSGVPDNNILLLLLGYDILICIYS